MKFLKIKCAVVSGSMLFGLSSGTMKATVPTSTKSVEITSKNQYFKTDWQAVFPSWLDMSIINTPVSKTAQKKPSMVKTVLAYIGNKFVFGVLIILAAVIVFKRNKRRENSRGATPSA